jgi:hypothetical protein
MAGGGMSGERWTGVSGQWPGRFAVQQLRVFALVALVIVIAGSLRAEDSAPQGKRVLIRARVLECKVDPAGGPEKTKVPSEPTLSTLEGRPAFFEFGYDVPVADGERGVRNVPVGKKVEVNVKFVEDGRIQLAVVLSDTKLVSKPGEAPQSVTDVRKETIEVDPGEVAKFTLGKDQMDPSITIRVELSVEAPKK